MVTNRQGNVTHQMYGCTTTSTHSHLYHQVLECVNGHITMSKVVDRPCCNFARGKVDIRTKLCLSSFAQKFIPDNSF